MNDMGMTPPVPKRLLGWYSANQDEMPWRGCGDPYGIWLSEVMLQQTQISTVIPYWHKFMAHYPDIKALAAADEEAVLEDWAGLGYYSRGRNLHRAARQVMTDHAGQFPEDPEEIRSLPGIGEYTTAAICSIAFGKNLAVIDGNVERVICRHQTLSGDPRKGDTKVQLRQIANTWLCTDQPGDHNQAVMDLGRKVCTPRNPDCENCPIAEDCNAYASGDPHRWPQPKKRRPIEKQQWISALFICGEELLLFPGNTELLKGHRGPILSRVTQPDGNIEQALKRELKERTIPLQEILGYGDPYRHSITHRQLEVQPILCRWCGPIPEDVKKIVPHAAGKLPVLHRKAIESIMPLLSNASIGDHAEGITDEMHS